MRVNRFLCEPVKIRKRDFSGSAIFRELLFEGVWTKRRFSFDTHHRESTFLKRATKRVSMWRPSLSIHFSYVPSSNRVVRARATFLAGVSSVCERHRFAGRSWTSESRRRLSVSKSRDHGGSGFAIVMIAVEPSDISMKRLSSTAMSDAFAELRICRRRSSQKNLVKLADDCNLEHERYGYAVLVKVEDQRTKRSYEDG